MPKDRLSIATRTPATRSKVSNGKDLLPGIDGRSAEARRYRDISSALIADAGGFDRCSEARVQLIRRFAAASVLAETLEANLINGKTIDVAEHSLLSSTLVRLAQRIGINRLPKNITPALHEYLEHHSSSDDGEDAAA